MTWWCCKAVILVFDDVRLLHNDCKSQQWRSIIRTMTVQACDVVKLHIRKRYKSEMTWNERRVWIERPEVTLKQAEKSKMTLSFGMMKFPGVPLHEGIISCTVNDESTPTSS